MQPPRPAKSDLPDPSYHWTTRKAMWFLGALADYGDVGRAAASVAMSRQSAYRLRERLGEDSVFARAWNRAQADGRAKRAAARAAGKATSLPSERDIFGLGK
ncbi:MAG: hypothetical protein ACEQR8_10895 [Cypionkella sp.]